MARPRKNVQPALPGSVGTVIEHVPGEIYNTVVHAVLDRALDPGTKLSEDVLCNHYGVSRTVVRVAIYRLEQDRLVEVQRNRGCFVVIPDRKEAADILAARRAIEPFIVRMLATSATDAEIDILAKHVDSEDNAYHSGDDREALRLSGQFHLLLGRLAKSKVIEAFLHNLVCRSALVIATYSDVTKCCKAHDHRRLVELLRSKDADAVVAQMERHLADIERDLLRNSAPEDKLSLESVLVQYAGRHVKGVNVKSLRRV